MENSLFFLLIYPAILNKLLKNKNYLNYLKYLLSLPISSTKNRDDHATFHFHHMVMVVTLSGQIN